MADSGIEQAVARVAVRPRRLAYLIRNGDRDQLLEAICYATTEWGGMGQPLLPVREDSSIAPFHWQIAETIQPEVFIDYAGDEAANDAVRRRLGAQVVEPPTEHLLEPGIHALAAGASDSPGAVSFAMGRPESLVEQVALGVVPRDHFDDYVELAGPLERSPDPLRVLDAQLRRESLVGLTTRQYPLRSAEGYWGDSVWIFCYPRLSLAQAIVFWNTRALTVPETGRGQIVLVERKSLEADGAGSLIRQICLRKTPSTPDLFLFGTQPSRLHEVARSWGFEEDKTKKLSWRLAVTNPRDLASEPLTYALNVDPRQLFLGKRTGGKDRRLPILLSGQEFVVHTDSPVRFTLRFDGNLWFDLDEVEALRWPHSSAVAHLIHDQASFTSLGVSIPTRPQARYEVTYRRPSAVDVVTAMLSERGWTWTPSDKGRYASALVRNRDAPERLEVLRSADTYELVTRLVSLTSRKIEPIIRLISEQDLPNEQISAQLQRAASVGSPVWKTVQDLSSETAWRRPRVLKSLGQLVASGLVRRGLEFRAECVA